MKSPQPHSPRYLSSWSPSTRWGPLVRPLYEQLAARPAPNDAVPAWIELAIVLGDNRAAPLALLVLVYARSLGPSAEMDRRIQAHVDLCAMDLGLAAPAQPGPVLLRDLGAPGVVVPREEGALAQWLRLELSPFEGHMERAAMFALRLLAVRTGVLEAPADMTLERLSVGVSSEP
jgi:hypothetical protein